MAVSKFIAPPTLSEKIEKEANFFDREFYMSYSGLNKLMYSPGLFYTHYVLKEKDDSYDQNMVEGSLIHCLLLDKHTFDDKFMLSPSNTPSDSQRDILDSLYAHYKVLKNDDALDGRESLEDFSPAILDLLEDRNLYQSMKEETRLTKMINEVTVEYWEYLKTAEGKLIISQETYDFAKNVVDKITSNPLVMECMGFFGDAMNGIKSENEVEFTVKPGEFEGGRLSDFVFGFRAIMDNLVFDNKNKVIRINDLKKSSKTLSSFKDSIEYFNYWIQAALYVEIIQNKYPEFKPEFRFIVIDSQMQIAPIKISDETMTQWKERLTNALLEANYHFINRNFELPYEFLVNKELTI